MLRMGRRVALQVTTALAVSVALARVAGAEGPAGTVPPADSAFAVELVVSRMQGDAGNAVVSNGIPLPPGVLSPRMGAKWSLQVEGEVVSADVRALSGRHRDGSVRAVYVRFQYPLRRGDRARARLTLEVLPKSGREVSAPSVDVPGFPEAVALPVSPAYLISTDLVGPTLPVQDTRRLGREWDRYESDFVKWSEFHWTKYGVDWAAGNYYDRVAVYYAWWVRTGNPEYWRRATLMALDYRTRYLEPNKYGSSHHWAQLEGLALHYLLTGDAASQVAVGRTADVLASYYRRGALGKRNHQDMESRGQARSLLAFLLSWEIQAPGGENYTSASWAEHLPLMLSQILRPQDTSGAFLWGGYCNTSINYMSGLLNDVLIRYYSRFNPDPRIEVSIRANADWLWNTQWRPDGSFNYQSAFCQRNKSGPNASWDLNNLFVSTFSWLYYRTGDRKYLTAADEIFSNGVRRAVLSGTKQFNQQFTASYHYLWYRRGPVQ